MSGLLAATLQVSAILVVAFGLMSLFRKKAAGLRHAIIMTAMACAAIVPALSAYMPSWPRAIVPTFIEASLASPLASPSPGESQNTAEPATRATGAPRPAGAVPASVATPVRRWRDELPAALDFAYAVYVAGVAISLAALALGLLRLRWIAARAVPLRSTRWQRRATAIAIAFDLKRPVHLAVCSQSVLATWGVARPQLLLPEGAEDWRDDRVRAVLLHEFAHVRRNDWIIQVLAGMLRAVYWFNPLVWMAFAHLRQESEQACDDAAIQQGEDGVEYAEHLLALARSLGKPAMLRLPAAPSMARHSTLKRRVAVVLNPATPHAAPTRASVAGISAAMLALTIAIAACNGRQPATIAGSVSPDSPPTAPIAEANPTPTIEVDPAPKASEIATAPAETTAPRIAASASQTRAQPRSPVAITADILDLVQSALADESLAVLDEVQRPITGLHHIRRFAQTVVNDERRNPATQAADYLEIINALKNTATFASNVTGAPRGAALSKQKIDQLAAAMREKAEELADAIMPTPHVTSVVVSTPEHRAAISALDLAQTTLRDTAFVGPRSVSWLGNELDTLEQAAQSVLSDTGTDQGGLTMKLYALRGALLSTSRNANNIARRPRVNPDALRNATALSTSVRRIASQLDAAMPRTWNSVPADDGEP